MRNIKVALLVTLLLSLSGINSVLAEGLKIGAVNTMRVLEKSPQALSADALIKKEFSSRDRALVAQQKKTKTMEDRLAKDGAIMSEPERKKLERDIVNARRDLKRDQDEFREDVNFRFNEERTKIQKEIFDSIQAVAKANGYDLVLFDGVAYASPKVDLSEMVINYLKEKKQGK
ncbi:MAG: OmpH family outer membrane protein [Gammaproteobacteria bacterium]|nr:MAG: OmpH family outer membrane protein [Gammaproteobacteria bacterium]RKZ70408.1 MAG: OmpH family outer membrane protein [Gammaproteobacteria bacterium]